MDSFAVGTKSIVDTAYDTRLHPDGQNDQRHNALCLRRNSCDMAVSDVDASQHRCCLSTARFCRLLLLTSLFGLTSCAMPWLDHSTNSDLQRELIQGSAAQRLALATFSKEKPALSIRFFNHREAVLPLACCNGSPEAWVQRNRILVLDAPSLSVEDLISRDRSRPEDFVWRGGQVAILDVSGTIVMRSELRIKASIVTLSPEGQLLRGRQLSCLIPPI